MLKENILRSFFMVIAFILGGCAFIPRQVDINLLEQRIVYAPESYSSRYHINFEPFVDRRANKSKLGVARNKLMMVTTSVSISGDLKGLLEKVVKQNFAANGIDHGTSPLTLKGAILDARTDAVGADHIFVQVRASLTLVNSRDNTPIFHRVLNGKEITPVTQVSNSAWEDAFVGAINQISGQVQLIALETATWVSSSRRPGSAESIVSTGSCVIVHPEGLVLTAYHVVEDSEKLIVHLTDGRTLKASIVQSDAVNDLALLKVSESSLNYLHLAPLRSTRIGQYVFTIGFPAVSVLGTEPKFTEGSISALSGPGGEASLLQISVPVQPGNSGGPMVNEAGELVGVITSTASVAHFFKETGTLPQNVNWAVKADYARPLFDLPSPLPPAQNRDEAITRAENATCFIVGSTKDE